MAPRPLNGLALCSGGGALDLGLRLALGPGYRTVAHVERDPFAAAVLVARMADEALDQAHVWDDLRSFDGEPWRGLVDLVTAGFPCQPFSAAGQKLGLDDARWLWPDVARVVHDVEPGFVFVENVRGFLSEHGGLGAVLGDLAALGFDAEWEVLSAAAVGASHRRERFWLLAYRHERRLPFLGREPGHDGHPWNHADRPCCEAVADTDRLGWVTGERLHDAWQPDSPGGREDPGTESQPGGQLMANPTSEGREGCVHGTPQRWPGPAGGSRGLFPPGPDDRAGWERAAGGPQPSIRRVADGLAHRLDRLHVIGNGVVPLVAATALVRLGRRAGLWTTDGDDLVTAPHLDWNGKDE